MAVNTLNQNKDFARSTGTDRSPVDQNNVEFAYVPYWIRDELMKNKCSMKDVLSYAKIKELFSYNDFVDLICINSKLKEIAKIKYLDISSDLFPIYYREQGSGDFLANAYKHIDEARIKNIRARFDQESPTPLPILSATRVETDPYPEEVNKEVVVTPAYSVNIMTSTAVLVVFEVGFFSRLGDSGELNKFFAECLKAMYGIAAIHEVNKTSLFRAYLNTL